MLEYQEMGENGACKSWKWLRYQLVLEEVGQEGGLLSQDK